MATLSGIQLSKAALSHKLVPRRRHVSQLLPDALATEPLLEIPAAYQSPEALQSLQHAGAVKGAVPEPCAAGAGASARGAPASHEPLRCVLCILCCTCRCALAVLRYK